MALLRPNLGVRLDYVTLDVYIGPGLTSGGFYRVYGDNIFPDLSDHWSTNGVQRLRNVHNGTEAFVQQLDRRSLCVSRSPRSMVRKRRRSAGRVNPLAALRHGEQSNNLILTENVKQMALKKLAGDHIYGK